MYNIRGDNLYFEDELLGPTDALYVDQNELRFMTDEAQAEGLIRRRLPGRVDFVFVAGDKVVGCESKKPVDLVQSHADSRLSRQLRTISEICDRTLLVARGGLDVMYLRSLSKDEAKRRTRWDPETLMVDLFVRYPMLGIQVVGVPDEDNEIPRFLNLYRSALMNSKGDIRALARTDLRPSRSHMSEPGGYLRHIAGVGKVTAARLHKAFGSTKAALKAPRKKWKELKISDKILDNRDEALK